MNRTTQIWYGAYALLWLALGLGLGFAAFLLFGFNYEAFTNLVLDYTNKQDWRDYFQQSVFPPQRHGWARGLIAAAILLYAVFSLLGWKRLPQYAERSAASARHLRWFFAEYVRLHWRSAMPWERLSLFGILLFLILRSLYTCYHTDLQYDEAWTYNHFVSKGIVVSAISPNNNHILYTILAGICDYLPLPHRFALRLPAMLAAWATCLAFYFFLRRLCGGRAAILSLSFFAFSSAIYSYALYARGYSLAYFFTVVQLILLYQLLLVDARERDYWRAWVLVTVLGMYSTFAYAYHWLGMLVPLLMRRDVWGLAFRWNALAVGITLVLYLPFILTNGANMVAAAAFGAEGGAGMPLDFYMGRVIDLWFTGQSLTTWAPLWWATGIVLAMGAIGWSHAPTRITVPLLIAHFWMPVAVYGLLGIDVPWRVWLFVLIYWSLGLAWLVQPFISTLKPINIVVSAIFIIIMNTTTTSQQYFTDWSYFLDKYVRRACETMMRDYPDVQECYSFARYDKPLIEYYYAIHRRPMKVYSVFPDSKDHRDFAERRYGSVLWDKEDYRASAEERRLLREGGYRRVYEDNRVVWWVGE